MVNHQVMIRDLDWSTKASNLVERVSNLNADAADLIQEVRVTRQGRYFPGKMCTAFVHLRDGASEEVAQQIAAILGGSHSESGFDPNATGLGPLLSSVALVTSTALNFQSGGVRILGIPLALRAQCSLPLAPFRDPAATTLAPAQGH